jgi:hypothetical protein
MRFDLPITAALSPSAQPDGIDWTIGITYLSLVFGLAALGYVFIALDIRAYLRSLRRALMVISGYRLEMPEWARKDTPRCILALGLTLPCTSADILAAYRTKVKAMHPDVGGDRREFMRLQAHFEQAMSFISDR